MSSLILRSSDLEWPFNDKSLNNWSLKEEKECSELVEILRDEDDFPEEYSIKHRVYFYNDKEKHYWNKSSYWIYKNGEYYIRFNRDYPGTSAFAYIKQNNEEFLITSSQYMAICVINLTTKDIKHYAYGTYYTIKDEDGKDTSIFEGFCPIGIAIHNDELEIEGCFWGCPYELLKFKVSNWNDLSIAELISREDLDSEESDEDEEDEEDE